MNTINGYTNGSNSASFDSSSSGSRSEASTPVQSVNGSENYSPPASPSGRRRGSRNEDTKARLFGPPESSPRKVKDHMKSSVFAADPRDEVARNYSPKKKAAVRRNPITGEVYDDIYSGGNEKLNENLTGPLSLPSTPVKIRQPPGGKSSAIFY